MLQGIESIFDNKEKMISHLKKKSYEENTDFFIRTHGHFFREMINYVEGAEDKQSAADEIAASVVDIVKKSFAGKNDKINGRVQVDLNFFMIYYVFPTLLSFNSEYSELIAKAVCDKWGASFKDSNIRYADYDSLHGAFRNKIFGIF